jgi:hypothetical protein
MMDLEKQIVNQNQDEEPKKSRDFFKGEALDFMRLSRLKSLL